MFLGYFVTISIVLTHFYGCFQLTKCDSVSISPSNSSSNNHYASDQQSFNVTVLLISRFHYLFENSASSNKQPATAAGIIADDNNNSEKQQQLQHQWDIYKLHSMNTTTAETTLLDNDDEYSVLENRKIDHGSQQQRPSVTSSSTDEELPHRNYFRILDKVFSRVVMPEVYRSSRSKSGSHCGLFIGCLEELPNFPALLKKPNVSSSFTIYTTSSQQENGGKRYKTAHKILYEPLTHYQLQDINVNETKLEEKIRSQHANYLKHHANSRAPAKLRLALTATSWRSAAKIVHSQEYPFDLAAIEQSGFNASLNTRIIIGGYFAKEDEEWIDEVVKQWLILEPQSNVIKVSWAEANRGLYHTAAYNSRIVGRQLNLFLHYLDQMFHIDLNRFHLVGHSLGAHIAGFVGADNDGKIARITGLDPAGPIFIELNSSMRLDPSDAKFVDVMHTNGGTITKGSLGLSTPSGHVDYYCNGGSIQPGCYFSSVTKSIMDPVERIACNHRRSYRYFIEIIKVTIRTNAAAQLAAGGEASIEASNMTLVDGHNDMKRRRDDEPQSAPLSQLPSAFLFEAKQDDLVRLMQPEIALMRRDSGSDFDTPAKRKIEFHLLSPDFPPGKRGMYFFRTRSESPFFATKQFALTLRTDAVIRRKIAISAKINQTLVAEAEVDEIPGIYTLIFVPSDPKLMLPDPEAMMAAPSLQLMWRYRSFNLLLNQQSELHLTSLEISPLEWDEQANEPTGATVRYLAASGQDTSSVVASSAGGSAGGTTGEPQSSRVLLRGGFSGGGHLTLTRNQWHRFEGKVVRLARK